MSLIKPGFGVSQISGKLGGTVYARNRGGAYARNWVKPTNPETPDQIDKWAIWTASGAAFGSLDTDQLDQWHDYANKLTRKNRLGEPLRLTAQQIFTECFTNASLIGEEPLVTPTQFSDRPAITYSGSILVSSDGRRLVKFQLNDATAICPGGDTGTVIIYSSPILRPSVRNVNKLFRMIKYSDLEITPIDLYDSYQAKFGSAAELGQIAHLRLRVIDRISMLGSTRVLVNAEVIEP